MKKPKMLKMFHSLKSAFTPFWAQFRLFYRHWSGLPVYAVFLIIKCIFWIIRKVTWKLNGVQKICDRNSNGKNYENSAHVLTVLATCKWSQLDKARDFWHYLTVHHSFQNPEIVLADNVMLIDVTSSKAVFVQFPRSLVNYTVRTVKFLFIETVAHAVKLIEMPLRSFEILADKIGDPTKRYEKVIFLFGIGRCGSTLISRMLEEADPEGIVFSEPTTFMEFVYYSKVANREFYMKQLKNSLYVFLKPISNKKRIYIKLTFISIYNAKDIFSVLPNAKFLFIHRDPLSVILSQERAFGCSVMFRSLYWAISSRIFPILERKYGLQRRPFLEHAYSKLTDSVFEYWMYIYADLWMWYEKHAEEFYFPIIYYDDLSENSVEFCRNVLKMTNISESRLEAAISVLNLDSQEGTVLGQRMLRNVPMTPYSISLKRKTDEFFDVLKMPRFNWNSQK